MMQDMIIQKVEEVDTDDTDFSTVGQTGGEKMHTLTGAESS